MLQLVIPAYNEEARLPRTLRELRRRATQDVHLLGQVEVIVVDNNCTDGTVAAARAAGTPAMPVRVVHCPAQGKGAAVRAGVAVSDADVVGFMDADGATDLDALAEALRLLLRGADVAVGSRAVDPSRTVVRHSPVRARGAALYRACAARIVPGVGDTQCGFKLMAGDLARDVMARVTTDGFSFDVELLALARAAGARIVEFPVTWTDVPGSTFAPMRHGAGAFVELASIGWRLRRERVAARVEPLRVPAADPILPVAEVGG